MIEATVKQIVESSQVFTELSSKKWGGGTALKIARLELELDKELQAYNKAREKIAEKYGEKDENGKLKLNENNEWIISNENRKKYIEDMNSMVNQKITINAEPITSEELTANPELQFEPDILRYLLVFIKG